MKKRAILFVLIVCVVTVYGILSADHYFQLDNLEKQMELAAGRIQNAQTARQEANNVLLDYYIEYTEKNAVAVPQTAAAKSVSDEDAAPDAETMRNTLNTFNIQDTRYQEIQLRVVNSEQNLDSAVSQYNSLAEEYNEKIASCGFLPLNQKRGFEIVTPLKQECL